MVFIIHFQIDYSRSKIYILHYQVFSQRRFLIIVKKLRGRGSQAFLFIVICNKNSNLQILKFKLNRTEKLDYKKTNGVKM